ncbi:MAG TPA: hypothetical protein VMZ91_09220 [Candidatus Paceibacterota bacterium]|nr:hypothetical protein [Candidatus Paceibacterota bacterium]
MAEVVKKRFLKDQDIKIKDIQIDGREFENKGGRKGKCINN